MWSIEPLGNIVEVLDRLRKPITKKNREKGDVPYYGATGIVDWVKDHIFDEKLVLVGEDGAKWDSGEKTAFIIEGRTWVNNHAHVLRPREALVSHEWLAYYLTSIDLSPWVTGLTVPKLNQAQLRSIPVPFPPLEEQRRIVAKLDAAFAEIDEAIAATNKSIESASALTNYILRLATERHGTKIEAHKISKLFKLSSGKFLPKKQMKINGGISVIGGNGFTGHHDEANLFGKNIVIGRVGANCGNVHFFDEDIWVTDNAMYVHSFAFEFDKEFLALALASLNLGAYARQAAQPVISFSSIKDVELVFTCSVSEQQKIVTEYKELKVLVDSFIKARSRKEFELANLKSAVLSRELNNSKRESA